MSDSEKEEEEQPNSSGDIGGTAGLEDGAEDSK